jgi:hypothetical protein
MSWKTPNHCTHARRGVKPCSSGNGLRQMMLGLRCSCAVLLTHWPYQAISDSPGGVSVRLLMQDTQHRTHPVWYHTLFVCLFSKSYRHLQGTAANQHWRSQDISRVLLGGVTYAKPSGPCSIIAILHQKEWSWDLAWWK